jgi:hypothetical protein
MRGGRERRGARAAGHFHVGLRDDMRSGLFLLESSRPTASQKGGTLMKLLLASILVATFTAAPAMAQDLDFSKITCKEFVSAPKEEITTILVWLEGFYTKENDPPIMYAEKTKKDAKALSDYCNAHDDDDVIKAADAVMPVK